MPATLGIVASQRTGTVAPGPPTSGLVGWWDADDASTFTYSSGASVSQWRDKSGSNCHLAQGNGANQPTRNGTQNGRTSIVFDPVFQQHLKSSAPATTAINNFAMFVACKRTAADGQPGGSGTVIVLTNGDPGGSGGYGLALKANSANIGWIDYGIAWNSSTTPDPKAAGVLTLQRVSGTWSMYLNGTATNIALTETPNAPTGFVAIPSATNLLGGEVYEALIYNRALSTVERQQVESYLNWKWMASAPPIPMTGMVAWYDADDAATITPATGVVTAWNDKSGGNRHLSESVNGPRSGSRTINGRNVLDFSWSDLGNVLTSSSFTITQPITVFMVLQSDTTDRPNNQVIGNTGASPTILGYGSHWTLFCGSIFDTGTSIDTAVHVVTALFNAAASQMWLDGASIGTGNPGSNGFTTGFPVGSAAGNFQWDGPVAETIMYNRALSTVERQQVESYLKTKWGTP